MANSVSANDSLNTAVSEDVPGLSFFALTWPPLFLLIGIPGNVMSFIIWYRRIPSSPGSTCLFLAVMCATDTYVLVHGCFRNWLRTLDQHFYVNQTFSLDLRVITHCQAPLFLFTLASDLSVWLIIFLCVERYVSVYFPMHMKEFCHRRRGSIAVLILVVGLGLVNSILFLVVEWKAAEGAGEKPSCQVSDRVKNTSYYEVWNYVDFAIYSFIPLAMIVVLNYFILFKLHQTRARARAMAASSNSTSQPRSQTAQASGRIFKTVAVMCVCHFVFTQPIVVFFLSEGRCGRTNALCDILLEVFLMLQMANHLTHFFIYSWTSSVFHADLVQYLHCCRRVCCFAGTIADRTTVNGRKGSVRESITFRFKKRRRNKRSGTLLTDGADLATKVEFEHCLDTDGGKNDRRDNCK